MVVMPYQVRDAFVRFHADFDPAVMPPPPPTRTSTLTVTSTLPLTLT